MKKSTFILIFLIACCVNSLSASAKKGNGQVYLFGFAASFSDTIVYFTDIQSVQNVELQKKTKFLPARSSYSSQLKTYVDDKHLLDNSTCAVFFAPTRAKLEKKYLKMRRKYTNDKNLTVKFLGADAFTFQPVKQITDDESN